MDKGRQRFSEQLYYPEDLETLDAETGSAFYHQKPSAI